MGQLGQGKRKNPGSGFLSYAWNCADRSHRSHLEERTYRTFVVTEMSGPFWLFRYLDVIPKNHQPICWQHTHLFKTDRRTAPLSSQVLDFLAAKNPDLMIHLGCLACRESWNHPFLACPALESMLPSFLSAEFYEVCVVWLAIFSENQDLDEALGEWSKKAPPRHPLSTHQAGWSTEKRLPAS